MEERLSKWFRLAEIWNAVMLLDEADVFLERRQLNDLKRNSLVSGNSLSWAFFRIPIQNLSPRNFHWTKSLKGNVRMLTKILQFS